MGYCCTTHRVKKKEAFILKVNAEVDSNELELNFFTLKTEEYEKKRIKILRYNKSSEVQYIIHNFMLNDVEVSLIYIILNTGKNYFICYDVTEEKIIELPISDEIGLAPTFQKLNDLYFIAVGSSDSNNSSVNLYDIHNRTWIHVGNLSNGRSGAYVLLNSEENIVFICGGLSQDGDNTFDIEFFPLVSGNNHASYPCEIKSKKIKNDFLLRKNNPIVLPLMEKNSYLICGGGNIFGETATCSYFHTQEDIILLSNLELPQCLRNNKNAVINFYKSYFYFFLNEEEVVRYSVLEHSFMIINSDEMETKDS